MTSKRRREQAVFPFPGTRIRGRLRGFETVWTLDRFTEVIRDEVSKGIDRAWPPDRIRSWIKTAFELDPRSMPRAAEAIETVLGTFGLGTAIEEPGEDLETPSRPTVGPVGPVAHAAPRSPRSSSRPRAR